MWDGIRKLKQEIKAIEGDINLGQALKEDLNDKINGYAKSSKENLVWGVLRASEQNIELQREQNWELSDKVSNMQAQMRKNITQEIKNMKPEPMKAS